MDNYGEGKWPGRLAQLRKTKKVEKIELASQIAEATEQFQLVKNKKKVTWKMLDCQCKLHKSTTCNKFATLTPREEEQEFNEDIRSISGNCSSALNTTVQETSANQNLNTKKNIDMLAKVREGPVGSCAKNSFDAQLAWRRVAIAIDSGVCDSVTWPEHVLDHEVHESVESQRGENFQSATGEPMLCVRRPTVAHVHEGRTSLRHGHESFACDKALGLVNKI